MQMTRLGWLVVSALILLLGALGAVFALWHHYHARPVPAVQTQATTTPPVVDPSSLAIYTSGEYGFSFFYPATASIFDAFTATTTQGLVWRQGAAADGTLIVRVTTNTGEARIGISSAAREITACTQAGPAEKSLGTSSVGSTTWNRFSFKKIGTDDEEQVMSYRAVHGGHCFALETFQPLPVVTASTTAFGLTDIVQSFIFAK